MTLQAISVLFTLTSQFPMEKRADRLIGVPASEAL